MQKNQDIGKGPSRNENYLLTAKVSSLYFYCLKEISRLHNIQLLTEITYLHIEFTAMD